MDAKQRDILIAAMGSILATFAELPEDVQEAVTKRDDYEEFVESWRHAQNLYGHLTWERTCDEPGSKDIPLPEWKS